MSAKLADLKKQHDHYIANVKARGGKVLSYTLPCCGGTMENRAPKDPGEVWDSLATCAHCGATYWKVATRDRITATIPEELKP